MIRTLSTAAENNNGATHIKTITQTIFLFWFPVALYTAAIVLVSIDPKPPGMPDVWQIDKVLHFGAYFVMGAVWVRALRRGRANSENHAVCSTRRAVALAAVVSFAVGASLELWQAAVPERSAEVLDAVANGLGGLSGAYVYGRFLAWMDGLLSDNAA